MKRTTLLFVVALIGSGTLSSERCVAQEAVSTEASPPKATESESQPDETVRLRRKLQDSQNQIQVLRQRLDNIGKMRALCRNCEEFNREFAPAHAHRIRNATNVIKAVMQRVELQWRWIAVDWIEMGAIMPGARVQLRSQATMSHSDSQQPLSVTEPPLHSE